MPFHIRDPETDAAVRELGSIYDAGPTETVKRAVKAELARRRNGQSLKERVQPILDRLAALPDTGLKADKAFYDSLNDEDEA
jgi:antitoxin VapB